MKLIHFADCHLGFRNYNRQAAGGRNQREVDVAGAFSAAIDRTIELRPDLVVIGGDVFHMVRPSNPAIVDAYRGFARLVESLPSCDVVMVAGNHDMPRSTDTTCLLTLFRSLRMHVLIDRAERLSLRDGELSVLAVPDGLSPRPKFEPDASAKYNVLLLHGEIEGLIRKGRPKTLQPSPEEIPLEELGVGGWNYIALGHYHSYHQVAERAFYSGSLEYTSTDIWGESRAEIASGAGGKGIVEHDLASEEHRFHRIEGARRVIDLPELNATGLTSAEVTEAVRGAVGACEGGIDDQIVRLVVRDIDKHVIRDLDHRMIREFKRRAMHFNFDPRRPDAAEVALGVTPKRRSQTIAERWAEFAGSREMTAGIDRGELVALGMRYLEEVEAKEQSTAAVQEEAAA
jgi:DNA repair protein SbcD/Mre11